jgi:hypothetical protein
VHRALAPEARCKPGSGGVHQFFTGTDREEDSAPIPTIAKGLDVQAIGEVLTAAMQAQVVSRGFRLDPFDWDCNEMNRRLADLPSEPDKDLR